LITFKYFLKKNIPKYKFIFYFHDLISKQETGAKKETTYID